MLSALVLVLVVQGDAGKVFDPKLTAAEAPAANAAAEAAVQTSSPTKDYKLKYLGNGVYRREDGSTLTVNEPDSLPDLKNARPQGDDSFAITK